MWELLRAGDRTDKFVSNQIKHIKACCEGVLEWNPWHPFRFFLPTYSSTGTG